MKSDAKLDAATAQCPEPSSPKNLPLHSTPSTVVRYSMSDASMKSISSNYINREDGISSAETVVGSQDDGTPANIPQDNSPNTHIVFAEHQRPPKKATGVLRIPSPREFERGI